MEFGNHIKNLLYLHDCIIIPELGGFVARYYPARIDGLRRKVKPPCKEFVFDDSLRKDGDLLVSFIARARGIEEAEARKIAMRFAEDTRKIVMQGDRAEVPGLGWFYKGPGGKILFDFDVVNNFHPETAGLPELNLPDFHKNEKISMAEERSEHAPAQLKKRSYKFMSWLIPLILIIGGLTLATLNWNTLRENRLISGIVQKFKSGRNTQKDVPPSIVMGLPDSTSTMEEALDTINDMKNALSPGKSEPNQVVKASDPYAHCTRFYIIAGSFKRMKNAQELSSKMNGQGYRTEILTSADGMYRVSLMVFSKRDEALRQLDKMKAGGKVRNIWLLSI